MSKEPRLLSMQRLQDLLSGLGSLQGVLQSSAVLWGSQSALHRNLAEPAASL